MLACNSGSLLRNGARLKLLVGLKSVKRVLEMRGRLSTTKDCTRVTHFLLLLLSFSQFFFFFLSFFFLFSQIFGRANAYLPEKVLRPCRLTEDVLITDKKK